MITSERKEGREGGKKRENGERVERGREGETKEGRRQRWW